MMRAEVFYQPTQPAGSVLLQFMTKQAFAALPQTASMYPVLQAHFFTGNVGEIVLVLGAKGELECVVVGAGETQTPLSFLTLANAALGVPPGVYHLDATASVEVLLAWSLAQYGFERYLSTSKPARQLCVDASVFQGLLIKANAVFLVRDLINTPTNDMGPEQLSRVLSGLAEKHQAKFQEWVGDALIEEGYLAIHAVGRASSSAPRLLSLTWGDVHHPRVTLVGKGVCFDSGGLDLKNHSGMRFMKKDMGGAAQVIGLADALMAFCVPIRLEVLIPAVENAVSGSSYRPGDVLTMRNGLTVEIDNTDAEGRLVLADALVKACEADPELVIDFATLTGAARVAVGTEIAAMFTPDDDLAQAIQQASNEVGDPVWRMPLYAGYAGLFSSTIADLSNATSSPYAGAITAALFLQRFVSATWVHFDVMAWNVGSKPGRPEGGEAMGMLSVLQCLQQRYLPSTSS